MYVDEYLGSDYGDAFLASANPYDAADNGLTSTGTTTPSWLNSLTGVFTAAGQVVKNVAPIINGKAFNSAANPASRTNALGTVQPGFSLGLGWLWIGLGLAAALVVFLVVRKK